MNNKIYLIGGGKGGVGKSLVTMTLLDLLVCKGKDILLIETDTSNPDTCKTYGESIRYKLLNLDVIDGWIELLNLCEQRVNSTVVINSAARSAEGVAAFGRLLNLNLTALQRQLVTLWVINRQRDSLELLRGFMETMTNSMVHVLLNGYFGTAARFELYNNSKIRTLVQERGGKSVMFPALADRVSDDLYSMRLTIEHAMADFTVGNRAELERWRREVHQVLEGVL